MSKADQDGLASHAGNSVRYFPALGLALGSINAAVMLCQLTYWNRMGHRHDGFFFKTVEELRCETGLSKHEQLTAVKILVERGLIEIKYAGIPQKRHSRQRLPSRLLH
jgi:hypothetical protein